MIKKLAPQIIFNTITDTYSLMDFCEFVVSKKTIVFDRLETNILNSGLFCLKLPNNQFFKPVSKKC